MAERARSGDELRPVAFFTDVDGHFGVEPLAAARGKLRAPGDAAAGYLAGGTLLLGVPGVVHDPCDGEVIGSGSIYTDGVWMWPDTAATLVAKYAIGLPDAFVRRMESFGWIAPVDVDVSLLLPPGFVVPPSR